VVAASAGTSPTPAGAPSQQAPQQDLSWSSFGDDAFGQGPAPTSGPSAPTTPAPAPTTPAATAPPPNAASVSPTQQSNGPTATGRTSCASCR
jgi:hypothetical protein